MLISVVLVYAVMAFFTVRGLLRQKMVRELIAFCLFFAASFTYVFLVCKGIQVFNPFDKLNDLLEQIGLHY